MILEINNLRKTFNDQLLFEDFSYVFKENGMYFILGESGSGKTTLLNILSLIDDSFEGSYKIDGLPADEMNNSNKEQIRATSFGYIFQNYNLFEDDTVRNNVSLFFDAVSNMDEDTKNIIIEETLTKLDIKELADFHVRDLSGGEKQRVAIARAIIASPKVIFCDEPTGSLDTINTDNIFKILKSISKDAIVICVTHDEENAFKYGDFVLKFNNKKIEVYKNKDDTLIHQFMLAKIINKKPNALLKIRYLFKHIFSKLKVQKVRTLIRIGLVVISLITTGISLSLSSGVHDSLMNSFGSIIDSKTVILNKKPCRNAILDYNSTSKKDVFALTKVYSNDIDYYGCNYLVDFENNFCDANDLYLNVRGFLRKIPGYSLRIFNEFIYTKDFNEFETYPRITSQLNDDEVVLSLSYEQMKDMCLQLQIMRGFETLGEYLLNNDVYLTLQLRNKTWNYADEQLFKLKGVIFDKLNRVYHTNPLFNEVLFEDRMRMPVSYSPTRIERYPWVMKKVFYIHTKAFQTQFLDKIIYDNNRKNLIFDSDNSNYSPLNCSYDTKVTNKLYVYDAIKDTIELDMINHVSELGLEFDGYYFSSQSGYFNNGTSIFSGFAKMIFFSLDLEKNESIIDAYSKVEEKDLNNIVVPKGIVDGYALKANSSNLRLKVYKGKEELKPNEIVVSKGFQRTLNDNSCEGKEIYATLLKSSNYFNGKVNNKFETIKLIIKGVVETDDGVSIYQKPEFSISLFRDFFKISSFNLIPISIIFETKKPLNQHEIENFNSYFTNYELSNPLHEIEKSINESTQFLKYLLIAFSIISIISSVILLFIITLISAVEQRREISIFKVLGFSNKEVMKMFFLENGITVGVSYFVSVISLIIISLVGEKLFMSSLGVSNLVIFSPLSIIFNFFLIMLIFVISSFGAYKEIKNVNIVNEIH